jgi:hypothetical protein
MQLLARRKMTADTANSVAGTPEHDRWHALSRPTLYGLECGKERRVEVFRNGHLECDVPIVNKERQHELNPYPSRWWISSSREVNRRTRRAKTHRLDVSKSLGCSCGGTEENGTPDVLHAPSPTAEADRQVPLEIP